MGLQIIGKLSNLEIAETCARSGDNIGSLFLDQAFESLVREMCVERGCLLGQRADNAVSLHSHPVHLEENSLRAFRWTFADESSFASHSFRSLTCFAQVDKLIYQGRPDDETVYRFTCFNIEDGYDSALAEPGSDVVMLEHGELCIQGSVLRRKVFDPVVSELSLPVRETS